MAGYCNADKYLDPIKSSECLVQVELTKRIKKTIFHESTGQLLMFFVIACATVFKPLFILKDEMTHTKGHTNFADLYPSHVTQLLALTTFVLKECTQ